jgi:hypothetical protein
VLFSDGRSGPVYLRVIFFCPSNLVFSDGFSVIFVLFRSDRRWTATFVHSGRAKSIPNNLCLGTCSGVLVLDKG